MVEICKINKKSAGIKDGIIVLIKNNIKNQFKKRQVIQKVRGLSLEWKVQGTPTWLHLIYGVAGNNKLLFWEEFIKSLNKTCAHILIGDLNIIPDDIDVWHADPNTTTKNKKASAKVMDLFQDVNLVDMFREIHGDSKEYSFIRQTKENTIDYKSRIDLCKATDIIKHTFANVEYLEMVDFAPDHCSILSAPS